MKKSVAFICVHNSCRSQMAEGYAKNLLSDHFDVYSAGTENYKEVKPGAVTVMEEIGIQLDGLDRDQLKIRFGMVLIYQKHT